MEIEVFNARGFQVGDFVRVIMNDGSAEEIQLGRGEVYMGTPERKVYQSEEIIPATPPSIVVQGNLETHADRGIPIQDVQDVVLV